MVEKSENFIRVHRFLGAGRFQGRGICSNYSKLIDKNKVHKIGNNLPMFMCSAGWSDTR